MELKPCPFCGTESTDIGFIAHPDDCYLMRKYLGNSRSKTMMQSWNTRPLEDALQTQVENLKRENVALDFGWNTTLKGLEEASDKINALETELAALKAESAWHPASELPKNSGQLYLVVLDVGVVDTAIYLESDGWLMSYPVVLWRELPAPPEEE